MEKQPSLFKSSERPLCERCGVRLAGKNDKTGLFTRPCWQCRSTPEQRLDRRLRKEYGISLEQRDAMIAQQNNLCAVCGIQTPTDVDHCHVSHKVRGVLCHDCNLAVGAVRDNPDIARRLVDYLELHDVRQLSDEQIAACMANYKRRKKGNPKLTPEQREEINRRFSAGESYKVLAEEFGIHITHVYNCLHEKPGRPLGARHGHAKLSIDEVRAIRRRSEAGERNTDLAKAFGIDNGHVTLILQRKLWKHVK